MTTRTQPTTSPVTALDLGITAVVFIAVRYGAAPYFDPNLVGPVAVITALVAATWRLRVRGARLAGLGLCRPRRLWTVPLWVLALFATTIALSALMDMAAPFLHAPPPNMARFAAIEGNPIELAKILVISWTTAAFGEELLFRGFLRAGLEGLLGGMWAAPLIAVIAQAVLFGLAHGYQGPRGMVMAGGVGLIYGVGYLLNGRNLWPLVIAHGVTDSLAMVVLFLGLKNLY
jgi:membrane protease YdiL (CAAX protease family)